LQEFKGSLRQLEVGLATQPLSREAAILSKESREKVACVQAADGDEG
jgi:hypothetical protein